MAPKEDHGWLLSYWGANVGRTPNGHEPRSRELCRRSFLEHAVLALFGEAP